MPGLLGICQGYLGRTRDAARTVPEQVRTRASFVLYIVLCIFVPEWGRPFPTSLQICGNGRHGPLVMSPRVSHWNFPGSQIQPPILGFASTSFPRLSNSYTKINSSLTSALGSPTIAYLVVTYSLCTRFTSLFPHSFKDLVLCAQATGS